MRTEAEIRAEIERRLNEYRLLMKSSRGYDEYVDNETLVEAEACKAELLSLRHFIFGA